jgi:DNA polymerase-3 subunit alpha
MNNFIDLHTHTTYSELDGMIKLDDYIEFAKENNLEAIATTDHGNCNSIIEFYLKCKKNNIKPIIGSEFYCSVGLHNKEDEETRHNHHLILIAKNNVGYRNIIKLTTWANLENFYYKPRITLEKLKEHSEGIICSTACVGSQFAYLINNDRIAECEELIKQYVSIFGDDFYIEYGYHEFESEKNYVDNLIVLAKKYNVKTIITNDTHYLRKEDEIVHKILMCKGENQTINSESKFEYKHNYYKNKEEIAEIFSIFPEIDIDECIKNTYEIINKCDVEIEFEKYVYSELPVPDGHTQKSYLIQLVKDRVRNRYDVLTDEIKDRIKYEMSVILKMEFAGYFLMVADYVNWAKENGIRVGAGRGSASGSIVCYILGITEVDPIKYNLIFERFLNPDRVSFPDIDCDFEKNKRHLVIEYLAQKYGKHGAVQISTKGILKGKSAIKTVASRLGHNFEKYNNFIREINDPKITTVDMVVEASLKLQKALQTDEEVQNVIKLAKTIEGNIQSTGTHAAGIILSHIDISDYCPIVRTKDGLVTAWSDKIIEKIGLIKFDVLGLSNLSIIDNCLKIINKDIDVDNLPLDDSKAFQLLQDGHTNGIFQLESSGMRTLSKRIKPEEIKHIDAVVALFRPGAMQFMDEYVENRKNPEKITYIDSRVKPILEDTYGQMVYQEQVMQIARVLAGYSMSEADSLRRAIGKKKMDEMKKHEDGFISGCIKNGVDRVVANKLFQQIVKFAEYSFNRAHSLSYAMIAYQTAYLKANYYNEFMCALLNNAIGTEEKIEKYFSECFENGIKILSPKINISTKQFSLNNKRDIVFPYSAIKGIGVKIVDKIIKEQSVKPFASFLDFCSRVKPDKKVITAILESGCFSEIEENPKRWLELIDYLSSAISECKKKDTSELTNTLRKLIHKDIIKKDSEIIELIKEKRAIKGASKKDKADKLVITDNIEKRENELIYEVDKEILKYGGNFSKKEIRLNESKYLSYQITTNINAIFSKYKKYFNFVEVENIDLDLVEETITVVGEIKDIREIVTRGGKKMAFATLFYNGFSTSLTFFQGQWSEFRRVENGDFVKLEVRVQENQNKDFGDLNLIVNKMNILKCLYDEEVYIQDISSWDNEQMSCYKDGLKLLHESCYNNNDDIEKILVIKKDNKKMIMDSKYWISNIDKYRNFLIRYKLM